MPAVPSTLSSSTLKETVSAQFVTRPTLRQVLEQQVYKVLVQRYPQIATLIPEIDSAAFFTVTRVSDDKINLERLSTVLLDALVEGQLVAFDSDNHLSLGPPGKALSEVIEGSGLQALNVQLSLLSGDFNEILASLVSNFQQAQVDYWNTKDYPFPDEVGVGRHRWMQQTLRMALASNASSTLLDDDERTCLYELLHSGGKELQVNALELTWHEGDTATTGLQADLLIEAERDERSVVLWCSPSGTIRAFASLQDFSEGLRDELSQRCQFRRLSWQRYPLEGDVFLQQSGLLLNLMLENVAQVQFSTIVDGAALEQTMALLTDPSWYFLNDDFSGEYGVPSLLPHWLLAGSSSDRFEYQVAMLDLSIAQALLGGRSSTDGVDDLRTYAARRLREQLLEDHPVDANYYPDDLILSVSIPDPARDKELPVSLINAGEMTLTELAIGHLDALQGGVISGIRHRTDQLIMDWMNPVYITGLIEAIDIGGRYPTYVTGQLDDQTQQRKRLKCFAIEWRSALLFDALRAKVEDRLTEEGWQALAEFCRSGSDLQSNVSVAPLAFRAEEDSHSIDEVTCMFVILLRSPATVLLYRPLYEQQALQQYDDQAALMSDISQTGPLQESILAWLTDASRSTYAFGGFIEPHLHRPIIDTSILPSRVKPATLVVRQFIADIDARMSQSKRAALIELANRQSVSNAEHRWSVVKTFSWLLFDLVGPILPGTLGKIAMVVGLLAPFLEENEGEERELANTMIGVNLAASLAMVLLHARLPGNSSALPASPLSNSFSAPPFREVFLQPTMQVVLGHDLASVSLKERVGYVSLGHGWGTGPASQRKALLPYVAHIDLAMATRANGLERLGDKFYVVLDGEPYQVLHDDAGRRIVGPQGEPGPLLVDNGGWKIRYDGFLFGGAPGTSAQGVQKRFDDLIADIAQIAQAIDDGQKTVVQLRQEEARLSQALEADQTLRLSAQENHSLNDEQKNRLLAGLDQRIQAKRNELAQTRARHIEGMEAVTKQDKRIIEKAREVLELKTKRSNITSRHSTAELMQLQSERRSSIVKGSQASISRLLLLVDYPELKRIELAMSGHPIPEVRDQYLKYKDRLREVVRLQARMIEASALLDEFIPQIPEAEVMIPGDGETQQVTLTDWVSNRKVTTVDFQIQQAVYYMELSMRLELDDSEGTLLGYRKLLMGDALQVAANAHGDLLLSNLSAKDRIEVLQGAWDEYSAAIINAIDIERDGGDRVDVPMLSGYTESMKALKQSAGKMLVEATIEIEGHAHSRRKAYPSDHEQQRVVYGANGQIAIGSEVTEGGKQVVVVRDRMGETELKRFEYVDGNWAEISVSGTAASRPSSEVEIVKQALKVLALDKPVEAKAEEYLRRDVNHRILTQLIDDHVVELQRSSDALEGSEGVTAKLLAKALQDWPAKRQELLIKLYSNTQYPDAEALRYLQEQNRIKIEYRPPRQVLADGSAIDEYGIRLLKEPGAQSGKIIWAAHFHFANQGDVPANFTRGHLKTWGQRFYGWKDAQRLAAQGGRIHRGVLTPEQAQRLFSGAWSSQP
ncbi:dermonecrotic toxin domain-containing protein [Pseudomonas fluorescens]|uniref:dermonecrotic toxin domain-containing protein n=1 Tax=Pseudomonas fluorescens TaxID=294 RepID=UPI0017846EF8|nr:DUF6543 domain-containing protein [Pseudomonas fluorescens]